MPEIDRPTDPLDPRSESPEVRSREVFYKGNMIIKEGEEAHRAFYIETGRVEVFITRDGTEHKITELGAGDIVGEMALINHSVRTASVRALETSTLVTVAKNEIEGRIKKVEDEAIRALINVLIHRLQETTQHQLHQYETPEELFSRVNGIVDHAGKSLGDKERVDFQDEVQPLLDRLQGVIDKYKK